MSALASAPRIHLALTRLAEDAEPWVRALASFAVDVSVHPCIAIASVDDGLMLERVKRELPQTTHIAVSSRHGARALARHLGETLARESHHISFVAVGPATARALAWARAPVAEVTPACAEGLLAHLLKDACLLGHHVLLPGAKEGRRLVIEQLLAAGISARHWPLYETRALGLDDAPLRLPDETTHVLFASPSQVAGFIARQRWSTGWQALSLGPSTTRALEAAEIPCAHEARHPTLEAAMAFLKRDLQ